MTMSEPTDGNTGETPNPDQGPRETRKRQVVRTICRFGGHVLARVLGEVLADLITNPWES